MHISNVTMMPPAAMRFKGQIEIDLTPQRPGETPELRSRAMNNIFLRAFKIAPGRVGRGQGPTNAYITAPDQPLRQAFEELIQEATGLNPGLVAIYQELQQQLPEHRGMDDTWY